MNGADVVARRLAAAGVREAYGIPGGEVLALVRAIDEAGIRFVLCKHENSGGFMAEGAYHATGAPGVLVATLGPGVANAVNVVANAWQDRVPLVFITGCVDPAVAARYTHQVFDHRALMAPVTKASLTLVDGAVDVIIDKALAIAMSDPPGPVHVDLPIGVARTAQRDEPVAPSSPAVRAGPMAGEAMETASRWLREARRPLVIAGLEVLYQQGEKAVRDFTLDTDIPLITTYKAKGIVDERHAPSLGAAGLSPRADEILLPFVAQSDLVVLAGYDPIEMRSGWCHPWPDSTRVVEFSATADPHGVHRSSLRFVGDVASGLRALVAGGGPAACWPDGEPSRVRASLDERFNAASDAWGARAVVDVARTMLPDDTIATVDSGAHRILLSQMWRCSQPRTLLQSTGLCTMGCALPLAIGYKRLNPHRPVAAFMGDACLEMVLGELATLRDARLPVVLVVFVDESLALIELKQRGAGHASVGVDFPGTDFVAVAEALGGRGVAVDSRDAFASAIRAALNEETRFTLIACLIGRKAYDGLF